MNFDKYKNHLPYPDKKWLDAQRAQRVQVLNDTPLTKLGMDNAFRELAAEMERVRTAQLEAILVETNRLRRVFEVDCEAGVDLGNLPPAARRAIHDQAWELGHSSGFPEVVAHYVELANMVGKVMHAVAEATTNLLPIPPELVVGRPPNEVEQELIAARQEIALAEEIMDAAKVPTHLTEGAEPNDKLSHAQRVRLLARKEWPTQAEACIMRQRTRRVEL